MKLSIAKNSASTSTNRRRVVLLVSLGCMALLLLVINLSGALSPDLPRSLLDPDNLKKYTLQARRYIDRSFGLVRIPSLVLDVKFKHMKKIMEKRAMALQSNLLVQTEDDLVPATIQYNDRNVRVKIRLKGDHVDHLDGEDKWSYRVHVRGDDHLFGMRRFSLQHPKTRDYQYERMFFETVRLFDVLTPRYRYVYLIQNGRDQGIMALEEHFSKELLESQGRREGVIIRFDESLYWQAADGAVEGNRHGAFDSPFTASIDAFQETKIKSSPQLAHEYRIAVGLLRGFIEGTLPASEVFDVERIGGFIAVSQFWGAWHAIRWHNLRFYLNPMTMRLEPIAFDANVGYRNDPGSIRELIIDLMLSDRWIYDAYAQAARILAKEVKTGQLRKQLEAVEQDHLAILEKEFTEMTPFDYRELHARAQLFDPAPPPDQVSYPYREVGPDPALYPQFVLAHLIVDEAGSPSIELMNPLPHPVVIHGIRWRDTENKTYPWARDEALPFPFLLNPTVIRERPVRYALPHQAPPDPVHAYSLGVVAGFQNNEQVKIHTVKSSVPVLRTLPRVFSSLKDQKTAHPFLQIDEADSTIVIPPGVHSVRSPIILPKGYQVLIRAGATLQFAPEALMAVHGILHAEGTPDAPVVLEGLPQADGRSGPWQGVVVMEAPGRSQWSHVTVRHTTGIDYAGWRLTGGVTFYRSDISMAHGAFTDNRGEDALNIIHADFALKDVDIKRTASDGFDADFSTGVIEGGVYEELGQIGGGDGIDVSGSTVTIKGTRFQHINDKAISVGEASTATVLDIHIEDAVVGAASKDRSTLEIRNATFRNIQFAGLMAYTKKPEYGPGYIVADQVTIEQSERITLVQTGSRLEFNKQVITPEDIDVDQLYETVMKKGSGL